MLMARKKKHIVCPRMPRYNEKNEEERDKAWRYR